MREKKRERYRGEEEEMGLGPKRSVTQLLYTLIHLLLLEVIDWPE